MSFDSLEFPRKAGMVELVDTRDLGSRALGRAGSTPVPGTFLTIQQLHPAKYLRLCSWRKARVWRPPFGEWPEPGSIHYSNGRK